ncbi:MAG TPA: glucosamine-6-phosphate deaminase [Terracidiphilus sp.]|nr:glucosamine-6-phosphate deaminase [Terracidiphilus sp.]
MTIIRFLLDALKVEVHPNSEAAGRAAADVAAQSIRSLAAERNSAAVVFATGASQLDTLRSLIAAPSIPWDRVDGFHLDEYVGISENHHASFRRYLRENLTAQVKMRRFFEIDGSSFDPESVCRDYAERLREADPQLCLLGIGENGHLAFNEPGEADFNDPKAMKVVCLDSACREQQAAEGWFGTPEEVPDRALTLTIPTLFRIPRLIVSVPGQRKARIVRRALKEPVSEQCPATILRTHPDATLFLDPESAAELDLKDTVPSAG